MPANPPNAANQKSSTSKGMSLRIRDFLGFQKQFPNLATSPAIAPPVTGNTHTCLDLMLWFQLRHPTATQVGAGSNPACQVLVCQRKMTPCWTWPEVQTGLKAVKLAPGNFYIANTLFIEDRDRAHWMKPAKGGTKPRFKFIGSCIRENETRAFPSLTDFVFCDLETHDAKGRCKPTFPERAALVDYCRKRGALACGFSPSGIHPVLRFNRLVCVADPDPTREMESAVRWFFKDFQLGRWMLDICSWKRTRLERACPLIYWDPNAVVKLPPAFAPLPAPKSGARGNSAKVPAKTKCGDAVNFLGKPFFGSNALERAIQSNICLCRLAKMSVNETASLTGKSLAQVMETWAQLCFPDLPDRYAAAIRSQILRKGEPLRAVCRPKGSKPNGLPAHWLDAPAQWFNTGKEYVTTASSFKLKNSGDFFAHSCGHSFQMFGDAGYDALQAHRIIFYWMALTDLGRGPHEAMQIARKWVNDTLGVSQEVRERSMRCLNSGFSWALSSLFRDLRKDFASRDQFLLFLKTELAALAEKFWGTKRQLRPISHIAMTFIERGVIRLICRSKTRLHALTSGDVVSATAWDCIPQHRTRGKLRPLIPGTAVMDMSAIGRTKAAKTRMVNRYFGESSYKNNGTGGRQSSPKLKRGSSHWTIPNIVHKRAKEQRQRMETLGAQPIARAPGQAGIPATPKVNHGHNSQVVANKAITNSQGHTFTNVGKGWGWRGRIRLPDITKDLDKILPKVDVSRLTIPVWDWNLETAAKAQGIEIDEKLLDQESKSVLPPMLLALRDSLGKGGHVYQPGAVVTQHFESICATSGKARPEALLREAIDSGLVVDVSMWVDGDEPQYAWRRTIEGEAAFARNVVWHSVRDGKGEIVYGDPGTGKTHEVACRVASKNTGCLVGSAQSNSALTLQRRLRDMHCPLEVHTVHKSFEIRMDPEKFAFRNLNYALMVADEAGQLDAFTAGGMSARWTAQCRVLLSVGPDQLYPVGPGNVGEDLIHCLSRQPLKGWKLTQLTANHRAKDKESHGIIDFLAAIKAGQMGAAGPGLELRKLDLSTDRKTFLFQGVNAGLCLRKQVLDQSEPVACFFPLDRDGAEAAVEILKETLQLPPFSPGEFLRIKNVGQQEYALGIRNGQLVEFIAMEEDLLRVRSLSVETHLCEFAVPRERVRGSFCLTGNAAQGMEIDFGAVVVQPSQITTRRWLFSAVSRCKKKCIIVYQAGDAQNQLLDCIAKNPPRRTLFPRFFEHFTAKYGVKSAAPPAVRKTLCNETATP